MRFVCLIGLLIFGLSSLSAIGDNSSNCVGGHTDILSNGSDMFAYTNKPSEGDTFKLTDEGTFVRASVAPAGNNGSSNHSNSKSSAGRSTGSSFSNYAMDIAIGLGLGYIGMNRMPLVNKAADIAALPFSNSDSSEANAKALAGYFFEGAFEKYYPFFRNAVVKETAHNPTFVGYTEMVSPFALPIVSWACQKAKSKIFKHDMSTEQEQDNYKKTRPAVEHYTSKELQSLYKDVVGGNKNAIDYHNKLFNQSSEKNRKVMAREFDELKSEELRSFALGLSNVLISEKFLPLLNELNVKINNYGSPLAAEVVDIFGRGLQSRYLRQQVTREDAFAHGQSLPALLSQCQNLFS